MKIILASESPQRQELFSRLGLPFFTMSPKIDEAISKATDAVRFAKKMALLKAGVVACKKKGHTVIGADTVVVVDGKIVGKPKSLWKAFDTLCLVNGKKHQVVTGIIVINREKCDVATGHKITEVEFNQVSTQEILAYIQNGEPLDKAGGYAIQGEGRFLVKSVNGCYSNVVGLPLCLMVELLRKTGVHERDDWSKITSRCCETP